MVCRRNRIRSIGLLMVIMLAINKDDLKYDLKLKLEVRVGVAKEELVLLVVLPLLMNENLDN